MQPARDPRASSQDMRRPASSADTLAATCEHFRLWAAAETGLGHAAAASWLESVQTLARLRRADFDQVREAFETSGLPHSQTWAARRLENETGPLAE